MEKLVRPILWCLLVLSPICLLLGITRTRHLASVEEARAFLIDGDVVRARTLFASLVDSPFVGERARLGRAATQILSGSPSPITLTLGTEQAGWLPWVVLSRSAFDRGDFSACLHLSELAEKLGQPTLSTLTAAALIESGKSAQARRLQREIAREPGELAERVREYLAATASSADGAAVKGPLLRDRKGKLLARLEGNDLELTANVPPELIPRAVAELLDPANVGTVRLALDLELSRLAFSALGGYRGSIVLVEPKSGEVLAAVSDRRTFRQGGTPAFEQLREPASISKLITATAALRAGYDPDAEIADMTCRGHQAFSGKPLYCSSISGRLRGLSHAMAVSCNVAFADLGVRLGRQRMLEELRYYGFVTSRQPFPYGQILEPEGDARQLADLSIGLEATAITPLHAALLAAVMANHGVMPTPTLIAAEDGLLGLHPRAVARNPGQRVLEPTWLPILLRAMEAVADYGTASAMAPRGFPVAMKTGTASEARYGFHTNYIGVGPLPEPRIAFSVRITDQPTSRKVRRAARFVTERLLYRLGRYARTHGWQRPEMARLAELEIPPTPLAVWTPRTGIRAPSPAP